MEQGDWGFRGTVGWMIAARILFRNQVLQRTRYPSLGSAILGGLFGIQNRYPGRSLVRRRMPVEAHKLSGAEDGI
jgi:hypothetical protein